MEASKGAMFWSGRFEKKYEDCRISEGEEAPSESESCDLIGEKAEAVVQGATSNSSIMAASEWIRTAEATDDDDSRRFLDGRLLFASEPNSSLLPCIKVMPLTYRLLS